MVKTTFVVIIQIYVVMTTSCLFFRTVPMLLAYQNIGTFVWSGSSKKAIFLKHDQFSHSKWSSNRGPEHEKGGHMNPMVLYCTMDFRYIKTYIFWSGSSKKAIFLKFDHFSHSMWS